MALNLRFFKRHQPAAIIPFPALGIVAVGAEVAFVRVDTDKLGNRSAWTFSGVVIECDTQADGWGDTWARVCYTEHDGTPMLKWLNAADLTELS